MILLLSSSVLEQRGLPDGNTKKTHSWKWSVTHCASVSSPHTTKKDGRKGRSTELVRAQRGSVIFMSLRNGVTPQANKHALNDFEHHHPNPMPLKAAYLSPNTSLVGMLRVAYCPISRMLQLASS